MIVGFKGIPFLLLLLSLLTFVTAQTKFNTIGELYPRSCQEILERTSQSREYILYSPKKIAFKAYCYFTGTDTGYTFLSKDAVFRADSLGLDLRLFFTTRGRALIRWKLKNGRQSESIIQQLDQYAYLPLSFSFKSVCDFATPQNARKLGSDGYLLLGLLDVSAARRKTLQGFKANGKPYQFRNCDANPNSYFAFFTRKSNKQPLTRREDYGPGTLARKNAKLVVTNFTLPDDYFFYEENHFGGCGGFSQTNAWRDATGSALGLPFRVVKTRFTSCKDVFAVSAVSKEYTLFASSGRSFKVYCYFSTKGRGYTFLSRDTIWNAGCLGVDLKKLYTTADHAMIRWKLKNGGQSEAIIEQLDRYRKVPLGFKLNSYRPYNTPQNLHNLKGGGYLLLGILDVNRARHKTTQGIKADGKVYQFCNCDANPNAYFAFFTGKNQGLPINRNVDTGPGTKARKAATTVQKPFHLPDDYFCYEENHFGGCGGYSQTGGWKDAVGSALGLPFTIPARQPRSCKDLSKSSKVSKEYTLITDKGKAFTAYCYFAGRGIGYTFLPAETVSRAETMNLDLRALYTRSDRALIRWKLNNGLQSQAVISQLDRYKDVPFRFSINSYCPYNAPQNLYNLRKGGYMMLGILNVTLARHKNIQGIKADGAPFRFTNCDANPNAYFAFFNLRADTKPSNRNEDYGPGTKARRAAKVVSPSVYLSPKYFLYEENHFGGCGGYCQTGGWKDAKGSALGLPFDY